MLGLFERLPIGVVVLDGDLRVTRVNDAFAALAGAGAKDAAGRTLAELFPELAGSLGVVPSTVLASGRAMLDLDLAAGGRRLMVSCFPVPPGIALTARALPAATGPLLEREAAFRAAFENAAIGMIVVDWAGGGVRTNRAMLDMLGLTEAELAALGVRGITHPDDYDRDLAEFQRLMAGEIDRYQIQKRYLRKDGGVRWGRLSVSLARDAQRQPVFLIAIIEDITEALRARDVFLSVASHELRTPLTPLKLNLQLLGVRAGGESKELAAAIRQVDRLAALVERLLDASRLATERMVLQPEPIDLVELTREVIGRFRGEATQKRSAITLSGTPSLPLLGDRVRLEQTVTNLVANALKFGAGAPIEVDVSRDGETARLMVSDHGIGMQPATRARIFELFERAAPETRFGGLGLSLYVTREIVKAHGGRIQVESEPGRGSTFAIELPLR